MMIMMMVHSPSNVYALEPQNRDYRLFKVVTKFETVVGHYYYYDYYYNYTLSTLILSFNSNLPDLRTLALLAQKQTSAVHIAKRSKYKRLLSLLVGSMSSSGRAVESVRCSF